ncbi:MAG: PAS domain-containing protein, partial [Candidatus Eisenbacteria bacterium]
MPLPRRQAVIDHRRIEPAVIDALHVGVVVFDPRGRLLEMNRQAASLLELSPEALGGAHWAEVLPPGSVV